MRDPRFYQWRRFGVLAAAGLLLTLVFAGQAQAMHPRPGSAIPYRIPLVSAFAPCPGGPARHGVVGPGGPVPAASSCPGVAGTLQSGYLTMSGLGFGTGFLRLNLVCAAPSAGPPPCLDVAGDQEDISVTGTITDVQCSGPIAPGCGAGVAGTDYVGPVVAQLPIRITDHHSGPPGPPPPPCPGAAGGPPCTTATVTDFTFGIPTGCAPVGAAGAPPGAACPWATTLEAMVPGIVAEIQMTVFRTTDEVVVQELGMDGTWGPMCPPTCGTGDEGIARAEGWFAP